VGRCWAECLGECDAMSGEHVFSKALFSPGCSCPRVIEGVRRIRDGAPTYNAEKANVLCRRHNSELAVLDEVAGRIASFQAAANDEAFEGALFVEGELFERWLLKSIINSASAGWIGQAKWRPAPEIVSAIFGQASVPDGLGLYSVDGVHPNHRPSGGVSATPIFLNLPSGRHLGGAYVTVHGMPLFASFVEGLTARLEGGAVPRLLRHFSESGLKHVYHPGAIVMSRKRGRPVHIGLSWKGVLRFQDGTTAQFPRPGPESTLPA
jgi:hypothetical protein